MCRQRESHRTIGGLSRPACWAGRAAYSHTWRIRGWRDNPEWTSASVSPLVDPALPRLNHDEVFDCFTRRECGCDGRHDFPGRAPGVEPAQFENPHGGELGGGRAQRGRHHRNEKQGHRAEDVAVFRQRQAGWAEEEEGRTWKINSGFWYKFKDLYRRKGKGQGIVVMHTLLHASCTIYRNVSLSWMHILSDIVCRDQLVPQNSSKYLICVSREPSFFSSSPNPDC